MRNGKDPNGDGFTDETQQAYQINHGVRAPANYTTDAEEIRKRFDIPKFDPEAFQPREGAALSGVYPDVICHVEDTTAEGVPSVVNEPGASLTMVEAPRGSGKSTAIDQLSVYQMEENGERIVRNGRQKSSDWRRLGDWTTLWLPSGVDLNGHWMEVVDDDDPRPEETVRSVRYYDDVFSLVERLQEHPRGTFNVVYPDPFFRRCEEAVGLADTTVKQPKFVPKNEPDPTPATHWWFAFICARTFRGVRVDAEGRRNWMTAHQDEFGMVAPQNAEGGESGHWTYQLVRIMSDTAKEMRSAGFSLVGYTHHEEDVHSDWSKEFNYWIELANGETSNRVTKSESPKPFRDLPMYHDLISSRPRGFGLCYNESRFSEFKFSDLGYPHDTPEFQFRLGIPESVQVDQHAGGMRLEDLVVATDEHGEPELLVESQSAGGSVHELRVRSPGSGIIDISGDEPEVIDALTSPYDAGTFPESPIDRSKEQFDIIYQLEGGDEIVAARIPRETLDASPTSEVISGD